MQKYEPWAESHKPQNFERIDRSGRWIPIEDTYTMGKIGSGLLVIVGGIFAGIVGAFVLYLWAMQSHGGQL